MHRTTTETETELRLLANATLDWESLTPVGQAEAVRIARKYY